MSWRAGPTKPGIPPTLPHRGNWRQEAKESTCLGQPSLHHLEMLAPPQRAAFPRAKEIPKAVASGRKQGRRSGSPPSATRLKCPPMALELPKPRSDPELRPPPPELSLSHLLPAERPRGTRVSFPSPPGGSQAVQGRAPHQGRLRIRASLVQTILGDRWPGGWAGR